MDPFTAPQLVLIDASHLCYRSWNVFSKFSTSSGYSTGMQYGVMRSLESIKKKQPQAAIVFALDGSSMARREVAPTYKAHRREGDPNVYDNDSQMDIQTMVFALDCAVAYHSEYECDDIIANICYDDRFKAKEILIYSGDNDFCQLVMADVKTLKEIKVWKPGSGKKQPERIWRTADVYAEWGVQPCSLALYRSIVGDVSDEIRGLPRVPRAKLQQAVEGKITPQDFYDGDSLEFFSVEWRQRLREFRAQCELNFRLTKLPWNYIQTPIILGHSNSEALLALFTRLEFKSYLSKFEELVTLFGGCSEPIPSEPVRR